MKRRRLRFRAGDLVVVKPALIRIFHNYPGLDLKNAAWVVDLATLSAVGLKNGPWVRNHDILKRIPRAKCKHITRPACICRDTRLARLGLRLVTARWANGETPSAGRRDQRPASIFLHTSPEEWTVSYDPEPPVP